MDWVYAVILGLIEGATEFIPVSSTGHLILAGALLGFDDEKSKVFDIAIQTGAIFAVIIVYWQKIRDTLVALPTQRQARRFALNVLIAFVPAVILGLLFGKAIKAHLFTPVVVASTFILGGFVILWAERRHARAATAPPATSPARVTRPAWRPSRPCPSPSTTPRDRRRRVTSTRRNRCPGSR